MIPYKNDGRCWLWAPSSLIFVRVATPEAVTLINRVQSLLGQPLVQLGDPNPFKDDLLDAVIGGGGWERDVAVVEMEGLGGVAMAVCGPISNTQYLGGGMPQLLVAVGGDMEAYSLYFEVDDLDQEIPGDLPRFNKVGGRMTWADLTGGRPIEEEWKQGANSKWYRITRMHQIPNDGQPLHASEWLKLQLAGVSLVDQATKAAQFPVLSGPI